MLAIHGNKIKDIYLLFEILKYNNTFKSIFIDKNISKTQKTKIKRNWIK